MKTILLGAVAALGVAGFSFAEDLTVDRGATVTLTESATYDTITVHGTLVVDKDVIIAVSTINLGPDAGDNALIDVTSIKSRIGSDGSTRITVGANGGTGRIRAMCEDTISDLGWYGSDANNKRPVQFHTMTVSENAAAADSGFIDVLEFNHTTVSFRTIDNYSATRARVLVNNGGRVGYAQAWGVTFFKGPVQVEAVDGVDFSFGQNYGQRSWVDGGNRSDLVIKGNGAAVRVDNSPHNTDSDQYCKLQNGITWDSVSKIIIDKSAFALVCKDNVFPWGAGAGTIEVSGDSAYLNLQNKTLHMNSLNAGNARTRANAIENGYSVRGTDGAKIIFGDGDVDGTLSGHLAPAIKLEKTGTGNLTVSAAKDGSSSFSSLSIAQGTVTVTGTVDVDEVELAENATLIIDGVAFAPKSVFTAYGTVTCLNGGSVTYLDYPIGTDDDRRVDDVRTRGRLVKTGTGVAVIEDPIEMPQNVKVDEGTLAFSARGYAATLLRYQEFQHNGKSNEMKMEVPSFCLTEIAFLDENGARVGKGLSGADAGTALKDLQPGKATIPADHNITTVYAGSKISFLFDGLGWSRLAFTNIDLSEGSGNAASIYMRLPNGSNPLVGCNLASAWDGQPVKWAMSASADDGVTWVELCRCETKANFVDSKWVNGGAVSTKVDDVETINPDIPNAFPFNSGCRDFSVPGVKRMPETMQIQVAADAELDFRMVTGGQSVDRWTIDAETGAGTIRNAVFANEGTLEILDPPTGSTVWTFATTLSACDTTALSKWTVLVDGVSKKLTARYANGTLTIRPVGLVLIVQ